jgi:hypothetical protein
MKTQKPKTMRKDEGSRLIQNVKFLPDYMVSHPVQQTTDIHCCENLLSFSLLFSAANIPPNWTSS